MEKIVITGYGIKVPGGYNKDHFKSTLETNKRAVELVKGCGPENTDVVHGLVHESLTEIGGKDYKNLPKDCRMVIAAAEEAKQMCGIKELDKYRTAVYVGSAVPGLVECDKAYEYIKSKNYRKYPIRTAGNVHVFSMASAVAGHLGTSGPTRLIGTGCCAGIEAVEDSIAMLLSGKVDVCFVGGGDDGANDLAVWSFAKLRSIPLNADVNEAGFPFSNTGFVGSQGAAILVIERESSALARNARIYGVIEGTGTTNDACSINGSDPTGMHLQKAVNLALNGERPMYINSQALGLKMNDSIEASICKYLSELHEESIPITSIKGITGHTYGASSIMQAISGLIGMEYGFIPKTLGVKHESYTQIPIVKNTLLQDVNSFLVTSHGHGGNNAAMYIKKYGG